MYYHLPATLVSPAGNMTTECDATAASASSTSYYFYFLLAAQALNAIGGSAAFTLAIPYMDTQIKTRDTPLYIGETLHVVINPREVFAQRYTADAWKDINYIIVKNTNKC